MSERFQVTAAELLRELDKAATAGPWHWVDQDTDEPSTPGDDCASLRTVAETESAFGPRLPKWILDAESMNEDWKADANRALIATTRNLLPLLVWLVKAADAFCSADDSVRAKQGESDLDLLRREEPRWFASRDALRSAIAALNAAAAKEVGK